MNGTDRARPATSPRIHSLHAPPQSRAAGRALTVKPLKSLSPSALAEPRSGKRQMGRGGWPRPGGAPLAPHSLRYHSPFGERIAVRTRPTVGNATSAFSPTADVCRARRTHQSCPTHRPARKGSVFVRRHLPPVVRRSALLRIADRTSHSGTACPPQCGGLGAHSPSSTLHRRERVVSEGPTDALARSTVIRPTPGVHVTDWECRGRRADDRPGATVPSLAPLASDLAGRARSLP